MKDFFLAEYIAYPANQHKILNNLFNTFAVKVMKFFYCTLLGSFISSPKPNYPVSGHLNTYHLLGEIQCRTTSYSGDNGFHIFFVMFLLSTVLPKGGRRFSNIIQLLRK